MNPNFIGLDLETSGSDLNNCVPIQIGMFHPDVGEFKSLIRWDLEDWVNGHHWSEDAFGIHRITKDDLASAPSLSVVEGEAIRWTKQISFDRIMVGWNVAGFDRPFLRRWLPLFDLHFSYRTVDLNAIVFAMTKKGERNYSTIKKRAKKYAVDMILANAEQQERWHDAGYDAMAAYYSLEYLRGLIDECLSKKNW